MSLRFLLLFALSSICTPLSPAAPALYEGFDTGNRGSVNLGTDHAKSGLTSSGWMSDWHLKEGRARVIRDDLLIPGLTSTEGFLRQQGKAVAMRQLGESFTGDLYGSFRVRGNRFNPNSMMGLMITLPNTEPMNPKSALVTFLATRWGEELGGMLIGGNPIKVESGEALRPSEAALVLFKMSNLPEMGQRANQEIQMWILNTAQVAHFAAEGMEERALRRAKLGNARDEVMQYVQANPRGSKLTLVQGMVVATFSNGVPEAEFDEIRFSRTSFAEAAGVGVAPASIGKGALTRLEARPGSPNILFLTLDDMNWDSIGAYGNPIPNISPHMDRLATEGMRFQYAYNQTSSCVPSRNTYQNGRYPHTSGVLSFFNVDADFQVLPEIMRGNGYITGVVNKPRDTSITDDYERYWDFHQIMTGPEKRGGSHYANHFAHFLDQVAAEGRPFYGVVNIADPHKPFYNDKQSIEKNFDKYGPSQRFEVADVEIPPFLPDHPRIHEEMRNYYNSVKRADDCIGAVLAVLEERELVENTAVILISDHGMPLPYAKSSVYADGLRTPWIMRWPGKVEAGHVDRFHLVSAIDFMPTVLEIAGIPVPAGVQGQSVWPAIQGRKVDGLDRVYGQFNDNAGGLSFPMRAIHTARYTYVFNAWGTGNHTFQSAATWHTSEGVMKGMAQRDPAVAARYAFLLHRTVEEFYDLKHDPHGLNNLIDDPAYANQVAAMRADMEHWMRETDDYVLEAYLVRDDHAALDAFMAKADAAALERAETLQWKRHANRAGGTGRNTGLYRAN